MPTVTDNETDVTETQVQATEAHKPLSLRKNFSWTFVGNVVYSACQWGILVVLAKLGTPEKVGQFALGLAVTAPVMMFSMLQLRGVQATDAKREYQFGDYLALRIITTALALLVIGGIVALSGYDRETVLVVLIVGGMKGVDALSDVYYGLWQQHERMDGIAQALMLNGVVSVTALAALMLVTRSIILATFGSAAGSTVAYLFTLVRNRRMALPNDRLSPTQCRYRILCRLTALAIPLGTVTLLVSFHTNLPRYLIQHYLGTTHLGIFAAIGSLMVAGNTVVAALSQSTSPRLARHFATGQIASFRSIMRRLLVAGSILGIVGVSVSVAFGHPLLRVLYGAEYARSTDCFVLLMIASGLGYIATFLGCGITSARHFTVQPLIGAISLLAGFLSGIALVPHFGLTGASWMVIVSMIVRIIASIFVYEYAIRHCENRGG